MRKKSKKNTNTTSIVKYVILSFLTLGIYELIWMYKTWEYIGYEFDMNLNSAKRTIFSFYFIGSLSWYINILNKKEKNINLLISISIGFTYFLSIFLSAAFENYLLKFFTIIPVIPLIIIVNKLHSNKDEELTIETPNKCDNESNRTNE